MIRRGIKYINTKNRNCGENIAKGEFCCLLVKQKRTWQLSYLLHVSPHHLGENVRMFHAVSLKKKMECNGFDQ